jgi:pyridoxamine 5'-phosphate oxidase
MDAIAEIEPFEPFRRWFTEAQQHEAAADAMILATASPDGRPSARAVLLKGFDERGFVFYTNFESRKADELQENPHAALCFHWKPQQRQLRIEGRIEEVSATEADAYFSSRARVSQIGAWASDQSRPLSSRAELEHRVDEFARRFADAPVPRPPSWSGFRVVPQRIEFWQERPYRLHDRIVFTREGGGWLKARLFP